MRDKKRVTDGAATPTRRWQPTRRQVILASAPCLGGIAIGGYAWIASAPDFTIDAPRHGAQLPIETSIETRGACKVDLRGDVVWLVVRVLSTNLYYVQSHDAKNGSSVDTASGRWSSTLTLGRPDREGERYAVQLYRAPAEGPTSRAFSQWLRDSAAIGSYAGFPRIPADAARVASIIVAPQGTAH